MADQRWIPVSERLPDDGTVVLAYYPDAEAQDGWIEAALYATDITPDKPWSCEAASALGLGTPTHWMPLPEPPSA